MAENSAIEWTTHTFNPWIGCMKVSPGCKNCYASVNTFTRAQRSRGRELWGPASTTDRHVTSDAKWREPVKWNREAEAAGVSARVFCASMADVFEDHPSLPPIRERLWPLIESTPWLDWQILTKRPENVMSMVPEYWRSGMASEYWRAAFPSNVWIGTSVEDQQRADERIPKLLKIPARVHFLSVEPLLSEVDLQPYFHAMGETLSLRPLVVVPRIDWVIVGGESGAGARPFDIGWARAIVRQCRAHRVAVFVKQLGACVRFPPEEWVGRNLRDLVQHPTGGVLGFRLHDRKGGDMAEWPADLRIREMPA